MSDKELKEIIENINIEFGTQESAHDADVLQGSNKIRLLNKTKALNQKSSSQRFHNQYVYFNRRKYFVTICLG